MKLGYIVAILFAGLFFAQSAFATLYLYDVPNANNGGMSGVDKLDSISSSYDTITNRFTWDVAFNTNPTDVDGFWLVVNNGPNPKSSDVNELAIMYGDLATGTLSTYVYNGLNSSNSWSTPGILLQKDTFSVSTDGFSLDIDVSAINAWSADPDYAGISYDENIGVWFHISIGSTFAYDNEGKITQYSYANQGWYDTAHQRARIPEPSSLLLLVAGLLGFRKFKS